MYSRRQLLEKRDVAELRRLVASGSLTLLRRGWYAAPNATPDVVEAVTAGGALSCVSALAVHGLWIPPGYSDRLHLRASKHLANRRSCRLPGGSQPVTAALDNLGDALACASSCMTDEDWVIVVDSALNKNALTIPRLQEQMGVVSARMRRLMQRCDARSESGTESAVRFRLQSRRVVVEVQPEVDTVGRVDLRVGRILIECDSVEHHTGAETYQKDRNRDRAAILRGEVTFRVTYGDVFYDWGRAGSDLFGLIGADRHRDRRRNRPV
ncbi:hypothetical protein [Williamsia deligens]|uniref:DUF559 domain-containing protein n=1 Tax=Williamsia deligens TaxID=321325 RepID=A0ABW3G3T0_9NOCA|nr:hypothetical protein [Williamsia deligens]MCP2194536.1 protein of unknown function (DUF4095) [Williamsia deligens]